MTSTTHPTTYSRSSGRITPVVLGLCIVDAALLVVSGVLHLHLAMTAYRHVSTLNWLFVVQFASTVVAALVLLVTRHPLVAIGSALLMAGTIVGYILSRTSGIFGFSYDKWTTDAVTSLIVETAAIIVLCITTAVLRRRG
jgi:hypothetical protein